MSYQDDRDEFLLAMARAWGWSAADSRRALRLAATLKRLAEAVCNGDWPADNGERPTAECPICHVAWAVTAVKKAGCPDCRAEEALQELAAPAEVRIQGDPRGCVASIWSPADDRFVCIPTR